MNLGLASGLGLRLKLALIGHGPGIKFRLELGAELNTG